VAFKIIWITKCFSRLGSLGIPDQLTFQVSWCSKYIVLKSPCIPDHLASSICCSRSSDVQDPLMFQITWHSQLAFRINSLNLYSGFLVTGQHGQTKPVIHCPSHRYCALGCEIQGPGSSMINAFFEIGHCLCLMMRFCYYDEPMN
jgi:hypothetical protein